MRVVVCACIPCWPVSIACETAAGAMKGVFGMVAICMLEYILISLWNMQPIPNYVYGHYPLSISCCDRAAGIGLFAGTGCNDVSGGPSSTYLGNFSDSLIDPHGAPLPEALICSGPLVRMSKRHRCGLADLLVVHARPWYLLEHPPSVSGSAARRCEFIKELELAMLVRWELWAPPLEHRTSDDLLAAVESCLIEAGLKFFGRSAIGEPEPLVAARTWRLELLRELRMNRVDTFPEDEVALVELLRIATLDAASEQIETNDVLATTGDFDCSPDFSPGCDVASLDEAALVVLRRIVSDCLRTSEQLEILHTAASEQIGTNEVLTTTGDFDCPPDFLPGIGVASLDENLACDGPNKDNMSLDNMSRQSDASVSRAPPDLCDFCSLPSKVWIALNKIDRNDRNESRYNKSWGQEGKSSSAVGGMKFSLIPNVGKDKNRSRSRCRLGSSKNSGRAVKCSLKSSGRAVNCAASAAKHDPALCDDAVIVGTKQAPLNSTRAARFELAMLTSKVGITQGLIQEAMIMISGGSCCGVVHVGNSDQLYSVGPPWSVGDNDKKTKPNHEDF